MAGYLVLTQQVDDLDAYQQRYVPGVVALFQRHGVEVVVAEFGTSAAEGTANSVVVLKGSSPEALRALLDDPEYQPLGRVRHTITSNATLVIAPGFGGAAG